MERALQPSTEFITPVTRECSLESVLKPHKKQVWALKFIYITHKIPIIFYRGFHAKNITHNAQWKWLLWLFFPMCQGTKGNCGSSNISHLQVQEQIVSESLPGGIGSRLSSRTLRWALTGAAAGRAPAECCFLPFICSWSVTSHWMNSVLCASNCSSRAALLSCPASELQSSRAT